MLITIVFLFLTAVLLGIIMEKLKLPALLGYMLTGICFSPSMAEVMQLESSWLTTLYLTHEQTRDSGPLRMTALFIILYRAGLGLDRAGLKENGVTALKLSILPCLLEAATVAVCAHYLFQFPMIEALMLGFVMAAVSPAVIVPIMLKLQEMKIGANKKIPTMILASSTADDIIAISGFGICLSLLAPQYQNNWQLMLLSVPISIIFGAMTGYYLARPLIALFKSAKLPSFFQALLLLLLAGLFKKFSEFSLQDIGVSTIEVARLSVPFSYLFATISLGMSIQIFSRETAIDIAKHFKYMWKLAELILFVLIGAMVNLNLAFDAGFFGLLILVAGLLARSFGVVLSTWDSQLNRKEILFCIIAYLPKATVQATIAGIAYNMFYKGELNLYHGSGQLIITMAAMSILVTAPIGAVATRIASKKLLYVPKE